MPQIKVGSKIYFEGEKRPYTVQALDKEFIICTKPFAARKTVLYSIIDLKDHVRGPENMVFGPMHDYETRKGCEEALSNLILKFCGLAVSWRNCVSLQITKIIF